MTDKKSKSNKPTDTVQKPYEVLEVRTSYGMTLNLGNYESFRADAGVTVKMNRPLQEGDDAELLKDEMYDYAWKTVKAELKEQVKAIRDNSKKQEE